MIVKIKRTDKAKGYDIPKYAKSGDAGLDLFAAEMFYDEYGNMVYDTGISLEIPEGYVGLIFPRSSVSKYTTFLTNAVGVIDSGYRGNVMVKFKPTEAYHNRLDGLASVYQIGDRVAQLIIIPYPQIELVESEELSETERGSGGFGSTNNVENGC